MSTGPVLNLGSSHGNRGRENRWCHAPEEMGDLIELLKGELRTGFFLLSLKCEITIRMLLL